MKPLAARKAPTFAQLLSVGGPDTAARTDLRRQLRQVAAPLVVAGALLAAWAALAPLGGAIVAAGSVKTELDRKTVQHKEGGIVRSILVRDGDLVHAGQPLVVIDDVRNDAELDLLVDQLDAERIRSARVAAEVSFAQQFAAPAGLGGSPRAAEHLARETALFEARRRTLDEQLDALAAQLRDAERQAEALERQIDATRRSADLAEQELELNVKLVEEGFVQRTRLLQLQREAADYSSRLGEGESDLALARQRASELRARSAQARNQYQQQAADEAQESAARVRDLEEGLRPFRDQASRRFVRAPVDGRVLGLRVAAGGEVLGPGDAILDVVPTLEKLVVEARIRPQDIDHVYEGASAEVRITAFDARGTPPLPATVTVVSADRLTDAESGRSWYVASVALDAAALAEHPDIRLRAGMPAEVFVATPERTLFEYLAGPFTAFTRRAMREP
jgi:HlyD family type I secretion membrane fusion protein